MTAGAGPGVGRRTASGVTVLYDARLLVAADRDDRDVWADHRVRPEWGVVPMTTAPVVSQVSRSVRQVQLRRLLRGCEIVAFAPGEALSSSLEQPVAVQQARARPRLPQP